MSDLFDRAQAAYNKPFFDLIHEAHTVHREYHPKMDIQKCTLLSIKTGGCPEDCGYCSQSAHSKTGVKRQDLLDLEEVRKAAKKAKAQGSERFCMGAAWRSIKDGPQFDRVLEMVRVVKEENLEACVTLGMLTDSQAARLKEAGLDAYNHNLDTSREFYGKIVTTRTYDDRLDTLKAVRKAGISMCCGGIIGMGESPTDRCALLAELAGFDPQPESVPINLLMSVKGTRLENAEPLDPMELVRTIAVARLLMPKARVRLSAGRISLSKESQALAFYAGANSLWLGEKLLTCDNPEVNEDEKLFQSLAARA